MPAIEPPVRYADNPALRSRYTIQIKAPEFDGRKGVVFTLFHEDPYPPADQIPRLLAPLDPNTPYLASALDKVFQAWEVEVLREYFKSTHPECEFIVKPCEPIPENAAGLGVFAEACSHTCDAVRFHPEDLIGIRGFYSRLDTEP